MADVKSEPALYRRKQVLVEARQYNGTGSLNVDSHSKGAQVAHAGDFLVVDPVEVEKLRKREKDEGLPTNSLPLARGMVYVVSKAEFLAEHELAEPTGETKEIPEQTDELYGVPHFNTLEEAQQASANRPPDNPDGTSAFHCTIGDNPQLYSISRSGVVVQVPVVGPDATKDLGPANEDGALLEETPQSLQNEGVHDTGPTDDHQTI